MLVALALATMSGGVMFTMPSAQALIFANGKFARYTVVVFHHIGNPSDTISQKESTMYLRVHMLLEDSGGGRREGLMRSVTADLS